MKERDERGVKQEKVLSKHGPKGGKPRSGSAAAVAARRSAEEASRRQAARLLGCWSEWRKSTAR
jgi:hypothetical protein